jgi:hypothetical protein
VEWDSRGEIKADPSLNSFLFTLKNPHNFTARKFVLKAEEKDRAIWCCFEFGPFFGDLGVSDNCNADTGNGNGGAVSYSSSLAIEY